VATCIEGPFEIAHVGILFRIDTRIGEEDREVTDECQPEDERARE